MESPGLDHGLELSMVAAPALPILLLLLGAIGLLNEPLAVQHALWTGVVQLFGWGIEVGRRRGRAWPATLLAGLINGAFCLERVYQRWATRRVIMAGCCVPV
jgi:hypothetical protein